MRREEKIIEALINLERKKNRGVSALELSEYMKKDRANISRYLNELYKSQKVTKSEGRPVLYSSIEHQEEKLVKNYSEEWSEQEGDINIKKDSLERLVGAELSLKLPIQQAKAAMLYPPRGLHTLILGETGVGKSLFAEMMYSFAKEAKVIDEKAPFIRFNCADYADNPQLVVAQIFGVKKGAFTGADSDKDGLLKKADGGILFLDEIHRLSPQGQEMLFTFIDKGSFRRLGDTETQIRAEVQIISATTEDPQSFMLKTFTRRIPMTIILPPLRERTLEERYLLLESFIKEESVRLGKNIYVSKNSIISFLLYDCNNNIGQLRSDVQLSCAKAFLNYKVNKNNFILIDQSELQARVQKGIINYKSHRREIEKISNNMSDIVQFSEEKDTINILKIDDDETKDIINVSFYSMIEKKMEELKKQGINEDKMNDILNIDLEEHFKKYISRLSNGIEESEISKVVDIRLINVVEEMLQIAAKKLNREFEQKVYFGLALHLQGSIERMTFGIKIKHPKLNLIRTQYREEFMVAMEIVKIIENKFNIEAPLDEIGYITMFLAASREEDKNLLEEKVNVLVVMHGRNTATSMVEVANTLIGEDYVRALDMPLTMKAEDMLQITKEEILKMKNEKGLLMLVDMGSLINFGGIIGNELGIDIKTIDMVTTLTVIEAGRKALNGRNLDSIYTSCQEMGRLSIQIEKEDYTTEKELAIITTCFTGEGAAEKIKDRIISALEGANKIKIIPLDILDKGDFLKQVKNLRKKYIIMAIVGTVNMFIDGVPFISAQDVFLDQGIYQLEKLIEVEQEFSKVIKSLEQQIQDIDCKNMAANIRDTIAHVEESLQIRINHEVKIGILIHIAFLIERLVNGRKEITFKDLEKYRHNNGKEFILVKKSLKMIENTYKINIDDNELAHIVRMIIENV
ncbi:MAG: PRD domain-containing protein [Clostridium butyricum]|nr:PRD domain-containing protein [Clostridium butyricum]